MTKNAKNDLILAEQALTISYFLLTSVIGQVEKRGKKISPHLPPKPILISYCAFLIKLPLYRDRRVNIYRIYLAFCQCNDDLQSITCTAATEQFTIESYFDINKTRVCINYNIWIWKT